MADAELAHIQTFVLDPVGPLIWVLKETDDLDDPGITLEEAKSALADAIKLLVMPLPNFPICDQGKCSRQ